MFYFTKILNHKYIFKYINAYIKIVYECEFSNKYISLEHIRKFKTLTRTMWVKILSPGFVIF